MKKDKRIFIPVKIEGKQFNGLVDTGSTSSYINKEVMEGMTGKSAEIIRKPKTIKLADGSITKTEKVINAEIEIKGYKLKHQVIYLPSSTTIIIGMDLLHRMGIGIDWNKKKSEIENRCSFKTEIKPEVHLTSQQQNIPTRLLEEDFEKTEKSPKVNKWVKNARKLKHNEPSNQKYYPRNPKMQEKINEQIDKILEEGIIGKSSNPLSRNPICATTTEEKEWYTKKLKTIAENPQQDSQYCVKEGNL